MSSHPNANELYNTGARHYAAKEYKKALNAWRPALTQYQEAGKKREAGITSTSISKALIALGQHKEALVTCTQAVRLLNEVDDPHALRDGLLTMGRLMNTLGYLDEATRALSQAADIRLSDDDLSTQVERLLEIGTLLARTGRFKESAQRYTEAKQIAEDIQDPEIYGKTLSGYAQSLQAIKEYDQAENILTELMQLWNNAGKPQQSAQAQLGLVSIFIERGELNRAETTIQQLQDYFKKIKDASGSALADYQYAQLLIKRNLPEEALPYGEKALNYFKKIKNSVAYAQSALVVAQILDQLVEDVRALRLFDTAIALFEKSGELAQKFNAHILKGKALLRLEKQKQAEEEFTQAIGYYREHKYTEQEAQTYIEIADLLYQLGKNADAIEQSKLAADLLQKLQEEEMEIRNYRIFINAVVNANRLEDYVSLIQERISEAQNQGKTLVASSLSVYLTQATLDTVPPDEAINTLEKAIHDNKLPLELRAEAALNLGTILFKQEKFAEAAQQFSQAIKDFGNQLSFDISNAYYQLSEAYLHLDKPALRKEALIGAIKVLKPDVDEKLKGKLYIELASLIETEDIEGAIHYYEQASQIFEKWERLERQLLALRKLASLLTEKKQYPQAIEKAEKAIKVAEELDILQLINNIEVTPWTNSQLAFETAISVAAVKYSIQKDRATIDKIFDWSTPRKTIRLQPFLAENLGYERCTDLASLLQEEDRLIKQAGELLQQLDQLSQASIPEEKFSINRDALRKELTEVITQLHINRNVIAAACPDPGRGLVPSNYKMIQKITTLMPADRRWILINYDILEVEKKIVITTVDHIGRHGLHSLPLTADFIDVVARFHEIKETKQLPPIGDLKDIGILLFRNLIPGLLEREIQNNTYGFLQFITDNFLHHVPFELLFDGREYLGLKYPMAWAPSLQLFESTLKTKALAKSTTPTVLLGVYSNPEVNVKRKELAEEIINALLTIVPTTRSVGEPIVLLGNNFNRTLLFSSIDQPRALIYFSTPTTIHHLKGEIPLQPPDSLRIIEVGVTTNFDGAPIFVLDEATQIDPQADGLSLVAFLRHLVTAGAPSIVFTRWRPQATIQPSFASGLAKQLYEGDPIAVALLQTRRKLANKGPSPYSWLSYSLCGNPFSTLI